MKLSRLIVALLILIGGYFFYQNYQSQNDYTSSEAVYSTKINSLDPISQPFHNTRLSLIYESLIHVDANLQFQPLLAVGFGQIDDTTWQFTIKENVIFHNQEPLTSDLVVKNFQEYHPNKLNLSSIHTNPDNSQQVIFKLKQVDPLFLQKISETPILTTNQNLSEEAIGTGPYSLKTFNPSLTKLQKFEEYHQKPAQFEELTLSTISNNLDRIKHANEQSKAILIENLSPSFIDRLNTKKFRLQESTDLSLNFFLFNNNRLSQNQRKALSKVIPSDLLAQYTENLGIPTNQFLPKGVIGYNSKISPSTPNLEEAKQIVQRTGLSGKSLKIMLPTSADKFTLFLQETFQQLGLKAQVDVYDYSQENLKTRATSYDLIFLGWKNEFGDGQSFFEEVVSSSSQYNLGFYTNPSANQLINESTVISDVSQRSAKLQETMQIITEQDPIGIPLFENKVFYAINKDFTYNDRLDGFIDISSLNQK
jgi:peptide/nickel transport system substrate-binding protein